MSYEQFWEQDCTLVRHYRKAAKIKQDFDNQQLWLQGLYFYEALCGVAPVLNAFAKKGTKPTPYRDSPYPLATGASDKKSEGKLAKGDTKAKAFMEMFMIHNNKKYDKKGGENNV